MATIKSYSDLQQSKKLAEILPLESADMYYDRYGTPNFIDQCVTHKSIKSNKYQELIPCWSLTALFSVLPKATNISTPKPINALGYCCWNQYDEIYADNPVDACVAMIEKLHKLKML